MSKTEKRILTYTLASGMELQIHRSDEQISLILRQPTSTDNPLAPSVQMGTLLTPSECGAVIEPLLSHITSRIEEEQR